MVEQTGGKLVVLDQAQLSPERELIEDLLAILNVFSCRLHGSRNYKSQTNKAVSDEGAAGDFQALVRCIEACVQRHRGLPIEAGDKGELDGDQEMASEDVS